MELSILGIPAAAIVRSVAGWAVSALEDGKVTKFEYKQLGVTIVRMGLIGSGILGIAGLSGAEVDGVAVGAATVVVDMFYNQMKKSNKKNDARGKNQKMRG